MTTLSSAAYSFSNFHSYKIEVPTEIATYIIQYVIAGARQLSLGGGTTVRRTHHPSIYLNHPYPTIAKDRETARVNINIGEALEFSDLETFAAFFREGPGRYAANIHKVRFPSISYVDDDTVGDRWRQTTDYAYEAFELLYTNWSLMRISELQLCLLDFNAKSSVDDPGVWSLLKVRGLAHLTILGPRRCIVPEVQKWLKARTHRRNLFPWVALGVENVGPNNWIDRCHTGSNSTNGLTLGTNSCTTERQSPRDVQSNVWPITSGEQDGLCCQKGGGAAFSLTALNPTQPSLPRSHCA